MRNNFFLISFGAVAVLGATVFAYATMMMPNAHAQLSAGTIIVGRVFERNREFSEPIRWWGKGGGCTALSSGLDYAVNSGLNSFLDGANRSLNWYCDNPLPNGTAFIGNTAVADRHFQFFTSGIIEPNSGHRIRFQAPPGYVCKGYIATQFDLSVSLAMRGLSGGPGSFYQENLGSDTTVCDISANAFLGSPDQILTEEWNLPTPGIVNELLFEIAPAQSAPAAPTVSAVQGRIVGRVREANVLHEPIAASTYVGPNANCPARQDGRSKVVPVTIAAQTQQLAWNCDRPLTDPEHYQFYGTELLSSAVPARTVVFTAPSGYRCIGWTRTTNGGVTTNSAFDDPNVGPNRADGNVQRCDVPDVTPGTMTQRLNDLSIPPVAGEGTHLWFEIQSVPAPAPTPTAQLAILSFTARSARDPNSTVVASGEDGILRWNVTGASNITVSFGCKDGVQLTTRDILLACGVEHDISGLGFNAAGGIRLTNTSAIAQNVIFTLTARDTAGQSMRRAAALTVIPRAVGRIMGRVFERRADGTTIYWGKNACPYALNPSNPNPGHFQIAPEMTVQASANTAQFQWWCDFPEALSGATSPELFEFYSSSLVDADSRHTVLYTAPAGYICTGWRLSQPASGGLSLTINPAGNSDTCVVRNVAAQTVRSQEENARPLVLESEGTHLWFSIARQEDTFVITPASGSARVGETRTFSALYDPDGPSGPQPQRNVSGEADWSSGDSTIATLDRVAADAAMFRGVRAGTITVTARVAGCERCSGTATARLTVTSVPNISPEIVNGDCRTSLMASSDTTVTEEFAANVSDPDAEAPATCAFNFGDGNSDTIPERPATPGSWRIGVCRIQHTYTRQQTQVEFGVTVQATDTQGAQSAQVQCRPSAVIPALGEAPPPAGERQTPSAPSAGIPSGPGGGGGTTGSGGGGTAPICGNGILESGEGCDDGNTANFDGCASTCQLETPTVPPPGGAGGGGRGGGFSPGIPFSFDVRPDAATIRASSTAQFRAFSIDIRSGTEEEVTQYVQWSSADDSIARHTGAGVFHGEQEGNTQVTGTFGGVSDTAQLTVLAGPGAGGARRLGSALAANAPINLQTNVGQYCAANQALTFSWEVSEPQSAYEVRVALDGATDNSGALVSPIFTQTSDASSLVSGAGSFALDTEHFWQVRSLARAGTIADPQFVLLLSVLGENEYVASIARMGDEIYFTSAALAGTSITEKPTLYRYDSTRPDAQPEPVHLRQELVDAPTDLRRLDAVQKAFPFRDALLLEAEGSGGDRPVYLYDGTRAVFAFFMPGGIRAVQPFGGRLYLLAGASTKIYVYDGITLSVAREQLTFPGIADGQDRMEVSRSDSGTSGEVIGSPTAFAAHNGKLFISFIVGGETWLVRNGKSVGRMENFSGIATYDGASWDVPASYNWSGRRPRFIEPNSGRGIGIAGLASVGGTLYAGGRGYVLDVSTGFQPVEKAMLFAEQSGTFISADDPAFDTQGLAIRKLTAFGNILLVAMAQGGGNALYVYEPAESRLNSLMGDIGPEILFAIKDGSLFIPIADWNGASAALARFDLFALSDWSDTASFTTPRTCARGLFRIFDFFREI